MWMFGIEYGGMEFQTVGTLRFVLNEGRSKFIPKYHFDI